MVEVQLPGVTLASLLHELSTSPSYTEGLLLGTVSRVVVKTLTDARPDQPSVPSERHVTRVSISAPLRLAHASPRSSSTTCTFYDPNGAVDEKAIASAMAVRDKGLQVVGWYRCRRRLPLLPSARESAVQDALSRAMGTPLLMALLTERDGVGVAGVRTSDYRFFVSESPLHQPHQIEPRITNLVSGSDVEYASFTPSLSFPSKYSDIMRAGDAAPPPHIAHLEDVVKKTNEDAQDLVRQVQETSERIAKARLELSRQARGATFPR